MPGLRTPDDIALLAMTTTTVTATPTTAIMWQRYRL